MYGVNYEETFVSVLKMMTAQIVIALIVVRGGHLYQMYMKNTFLQRELEEVFIIQRPGFESTNRPTTICRQPLYGLKKASCAWNSKIARYFHQMSL